ncbi:MAG: helix-turn-helix transcriptional regulator [Oceanicaulis sp.]
MTGNEPSTGNRLDAWRVENKLTYEALGKKLGGVPHQTARRWCLPAGHRDRRVPRIGYLTEIVKLTGLSASDVLADLREHEHEHEHDAPAAQRRAS